MYNRPRIIPVLAISKSDLVKTVQYSKTRYLGDPINAVKIFNEKAVDELSIVDIDANRNNGQINYNLLKDIANQAFMPLSYGGGIYSIDQVKKIISIGYEKVIINSALITNPSIITEASELYGKQSVVVSIDVKFIKGEYFFCTNSGTRVTNFKASEMALYAEKLGAGEIIISNIDRDGTMEGYDLVLVKSITGIVNVPTVAYGGASSLDDMREVIDTGNVHSAAATSFFVFWGKMKAVLLTYPSEVKLVQAGILKDKKL